MNIYKTTISIVLIVFATAVRQTFLNKEIKKEPQTTLPCISFANIGNKQICFPEFEGMHECHLYLGIKKRTESFNNNGNSIIAFYLNDHYFKNIDNIEKIKVDDYFQIYTIKKYENLEISDDLFEQYLNYADSIGTNSYWKNTKNSLNKQIENYIFSKPILYETYSINKNIKTQVLISKIETTGDENIIICVMNHILIKNRIIFLSYYKKYNGTESIIHAKAKSDYLVLRFNDENK